MQLENQQKQIIKLEHVKKQYRLGDNSFFAVNDVSFEITKGEFIAIVGKSGSGKSTLLNLMSGVDVPTEGNIFVQGKSIGQLSQRELTTFRGQNIGIVFQFFQLMPTLTVLENVIMPMDFVGHLEKKRRRERAETLLEKVGMADHLNQLPANLSGGEQQRVAIARALANNPEILFADEPTGNLDSHTAEEIFILLEKLTREGKSVMMVTHNNELAMRCQRRICISDGKILEDVTAECRRGVNANCL